MKPTKYRNVPTVIDGVRFSSKKEANRDAELQLLQRAGHIRQLERQPRWPCVINRQKICTYVGDWQYQEPTGISSTKRLPVWRTIVEDSKGVQTPAFKLKWKIVKALFPEIEWRLS